MTNLGIYQPPALRYEEISVGPAPLEHLPVMPVSEPAIPQSDPTAQLVDRLARNLAESMATALQEWQATEGARLAEASNARVASLDRRTEDLARAVAEQKSTSEAVQEATAALREHVEELTFSVQDRVDALIQRIGAQQEEIAAVSSNLGQRIESFVQRLDRQTEMIREICNAQTHEDSVMEEVLTLLARMRAGRGSAAKLAS